MPPIQSALVHRSGALDGLDGLGRLRAIVIFDDLDLALAILELKAAALVDLVGPKLIGREMGNRRARRERTGFCADHADFVDAGIRARGPHERCGNRRRGRIFQKFASSHEFLPEGLAEQGFLPPSVLDTLV